MELVVTDTSDDQFRAVVAEGLDAHDEAKTGRRDYRPLSVLVTEPDTRRIVGGLVGYTHFGMLTIERFFVPESLRGKGLGSRVLALAEKEASERGCLYATAMMVSFWAPSFFMTRGYDMAAQFYCAERGPTHFFMMKPLSRPAGDRGRIW